MSWLAKLCLALVALLGVGVFGYVLGWDAGHSAGYAAARRWRE